MWADCSRNSANGGDVTMEDKPRGGGQFRGQQGNPNQGQPNQGSNPGKQNQQQGQADQFGNRKFR